LQQHIGTRADGIWGPNSQAQLTPYSKTLLTRPPGPTLLEGFDVSHHQGGVDMFAAAASGMRFVGVKTTQGQNFEDRREDDNIANAKAAGLPCYGYHYAVPKSDHRQGLKDALREAEDHLESLADSPTTHASMSDAESGLGRKPDDYPRLGFTTVRQVHSYNAEWLLTWFRVVEAEQGVMGILYSAAWAWNSRLKRADKSLLDELGKRTLCWADYNDNDPVPAYWTERDYIHQYTGHGSVAGVRGDCDQDRMSQPLLDSLKIGGTCP
jgi:GH25 family lysozyme M1 (1,4-beta-N-acetylmuramidase)